MARTKARKHRSSLGVAPLAVVGGFHIIEWVIGAGVVGGGGALLWSLFKNAPLTPPPNAPPGCGEEAVTNIMVSAAAGAAGGAQTGNPYAAAGSAGINTLLNPDTLRCGADFAKAIRNKLCNQAKSAVKAIRKAGGSVPPQFDKLSCDQQIAFCAALGALGPAAVGAAVAVAMLKRASAETCKRADKVAASLEAKGAKLPGAWDDFSCDQKVAFLAALGPFGMASLVAGVAVGGLASNAASEVKKYVSAAKSAVETVSKQLGIKVPKIDVNIPHVPKLFGLGESPFLIHESSLGASASGRYRSTANPPRYYFDRAWR